MKRRFHCPSSAKKEYVAEVMAGYRIGIVARKYGMHPETLRRWGREYQDEVDEIMAKKRTEQEKIQQDAAQYQELQKKFDEAMKLLGEKELEINILQDLVKKSIPTGNSRSLD